MSQFLPNMRTRWRRITRLRTRLQQAVDLTKSIDGRISEILQRSVNIEAKIDGLSGSHNSGFKGSAQQRYGHLSYSQHGEDMVFIALFERLGIASPTFLDIGANHPTDCSNTALLRTRCGSRGVNIDASPDVIELFKRERPDDINVNVGVAGKPGTLTFYRFDPTSGLNSFSKALMQQISAFHPQLQIQDEISVPVITLDQVIDTYCEGKCPDLLSLDAEGFDYEILDAATFRTRPKILCVETISGAGDTEKVMDDLITSKGFRRCIQMYANAIYVQQDARI